MKVRLTVGVTYDTASFDVKLEDLGVTEEEWNKMPDEHKRDRLQQYAFDIPETPSWFVESYHDIN